MTKQDIKDIVTGLVETVGSRYLYDVLDHLHIEIINVPNMSEYASYIKKNDKDIILLSTDIPEEIKDFVLGHEIGHAILHDYEMVHYSKIANKRSSRIEREADYFSFLLLEKEIEPNVDYTLGDYSKILGVSEEVIKYAIDTESL